MKYITDDDMKNIDARFKELRTLRDGWDGYSAGPIYKYVIKAAKKILEHTASILCAIPQIVPGSDGSLNLEWHVKRKYKEYSIEINVISNSHIFYFDNIKDISMELKMDQDDIMRIIYTVITYGGLGKCD